MPLFVRILQKIQTRVARSSTRIIVPSEYLKNIVAAWGIPNEKIEVIYNAVILEAPRTFLRPWPRARPGYISRPTGALEAMDGIIDAVARLRLGRSDFLTIWAKGRRRVGSRRMLKRTWDVITFLSRRTLARRGARLDESRRCVRT